MQPLADGQQITPEALRQIGAALAAAGASGDPALEMAVWRALSPSDRARAQRGDPSVQGSIKQAADEQIKLAKQAQQPAPANRHGPATGDAGQGAQPVKGERGVSDQLREGKFGKRAANDGATESSAKYVGAGMAVSGNTVARAFDIRDYLTSPATRGLVDMGMRGATFDYARRQVPGASINNIRDAGRDAANLRFGVNDKEAIKDHTIIRKLDPKGADATNKALQDYQDALDNDPVLAELMGKRKKAETPEERKALEQQMQARRQEIRKGHDVQRRIDDKGIPEGARDATGRRANEVDKMDEQNRGLGVQKGANPTSQEIIHGREKTGAAPALQQRGEAAAAATPSGGNASRFRTQAQTKVAADAPAPNK
jgi:hypothetical protein